MFYSTLLLAAAALSGLVSAQNYSTSGALTIVPDSVAYDTRLAWCVSETTSCPEICGGEASSNTCDADTLNYTCTCTDGAKPNISSYEQTLPYFICEQWRADCVAAHPNDLVGQDACLSVTCGTKNASDVTTSTTSATASATSTSATSSGTAASTTSAAASASSTSSSGAIALSVAKTYGTGILAAAMLALFGLAL